MVKNPHVPPAPLTHEPEDIRHFQDPLWRIHRLAGAHSLAWDELRGYGPITTCRFDPHDPPPSDQLDRAVMYAGCHLKTAITEVLQGQRRLDTRTGAPVVVSWTPTRALKLLDLSGHNGRNWPLANSATSSLTQVRRDTCRNWSRAIRTQFPRLDGLYVLSTVTGLPTVVLFTPAGDSFPAHPAFNRLIDSDEMLQLVTSELTSLRLSVTYL